MVFDIDVVAIVMLTGSEDSKELGHEADEENDEVRCTLLSVTAGVLVVIDLQLCSHHWSATG